MGKIRGSTADCVQRHATIFMASGKPLSVLPFKRSIDFDGTLHPHRPAYRRRPAQALYVIVKVKRSSKESPKSA
jgi:hypothetical protein